MKYKCADCGGTDVQVCLPAWFLPNKDLKMVDVDETADELNVFCENCGDCTEIIAPNGKAIRGRWR